MPGLHALAPSALPPLRVQEGVLVRESRPRGCWQALPSEMLGGPGQHQPGRPPPHYPSPRPSTPCLCCPLAFLLPPDAHYNAQM
ncbi:hypothetical protein E2C01_079695 [Portunus trituberculatus]|uniref:Uncharacterized protein n=1 Tax=Portunus trituberculatus TaxID=210409 RepID=A0A5B7IHJ8_PORTR|nr:hypothetical protein [Portunus trituberculatus]